MTPEQLRKVLELIKAAQPSWETEANRWEFIDKAIAILNEVKPVEVVTAKNFTTKFYQRAASIDECSIEECIRYLFPNGVKIVEDKITYV